MPAESALISGSVQLVAIGGPPALEGAGQGHPTRAIFASGGSTDFSIAAPTGGITNVSQLAGKKVGVGVGTIMQQYLNYILAKKGLTGKVTVVNLANVADAYPALINHSIDAYVDSGTQVAEWKAKGGVTSIENSFQDYPSYGSSSVVAVTKSFLKAHPNIQQAYWALYSEGEKLIRQNPTAYLAWTAKNAGIPLSIEKQTARITYQSTPISTSGVTAAQQAQQFLLSAKLIPKLVNLKSWFVNYPTGTT
ncbi:MAG: ABC transporter substrate-binding protein [Conexibacteraceae bacterium]|nr:ABC transporter substrate-binding protein [Conexibacteraceae bacterium]